MRRRGGVLSQDARTVRWVDSGTAHSTSTGDSIAAREAKLAEERALWRTEAREREARWPQEWVIVTTFRHTGDKAYWSDTGRSPYPGNALRYATEEIARDTAEKLLRGDVIDGYSLERRERPRGGLRSRGA